MTDDTSQTHRDPIESEAETARRGAGAAEPAQAPEVPPRVRMHRVELIGMILIAIVPLLALLGAFGPRVARAHAASAVLDVEVRHPARYRRGMIETLEARVSNRTRAPMPRVTLAFDDAYLDAFALPTATPEFARPYVVELSDIAPGETRTVVVDLEADRPGRHRGRAVAVHSRDSVAVALTTLVLP